MSTSGTSNWLSTEEKGNYAYEKYNNDKKSNNPWLKVIYSDYWRGSNRNTSTISTGTEFWISSRCVGAGWYYAYFGLRFVSSSGSIIANGVSGSDTSVGSWCRGLRPVLQVVK